MKCEYTGFALDCELVAVPLLRCMFAGLSCDGVNVKHTHPLGQRLHTLCQVCLFFWLDSHWAVRLMEDTRTYTACMFMREN